MTKVIIEEKASKFAPKGKDKVINRTILTPEYAGLRLVLNLINESAALNEELGSIFDRKWKKIKEEVKGWYASRNNFKLGQTNTIAVQSDTWVVNCLCKTKENVLDRKALESCIQKVLSVAKMEKASVHVSALSVLECPELKEELNNQLLNNGINVCYYEEPKKLER